MLREIGLDLSLHCQAVRQAAHDGVPVYLKGNAADAVALTAIAFVAVTLVSACVQPYDPAAFAGWSYEKAQAACNAGNTTACHAANNLWAEYWYLL